MNAFLLVALGSAIGGAARYGISLIRFSHVTGFPWQTLAVNVTGGLLIGLAAGLLDPVEHVGARLLIMTGICGGFTTFSAFSLESIRLLGEGAWSLALASAVANVLLSIGACASGYWLTRL